MSKQRLSIDIRGHMVKFVEGSLVKENVVKINRTGYLDITDAVLEDDRLTNCPANVELFKNFLGKHRFTCDKVLLNISDNKVITRVINLPRLPINDLNDLINIEIPKYFPIDISRFYIDYKILDAFSEEDRIYYKILLCAVPSEVVREYVDMLMACDLKPILVDVHPNSISRIYQGLKFEENIIVDSASDSIDLIVLDKGSFYIYNTIPFKLEDNIELYRNPKEYDIEKLSEQIERLADNIRSYTEFYLSTHERKKIDAVYVTGELAMVNGIESRLQELLGIKVLKGFDKLVTVNKTKKYANVDENLISGNIGILLRGV